MQEAQQLIFILLSAFSLLAEGISLVVTSHPSGDVQLLRCPREGEPECPRNPLTKSYLVCNVVDGMDYRVRVNPVDSETDHDVHVHQNSVQFDNFGISATTVAIDGCTELFIRFLGSNEHLSDSEVTINIFNLGIQFTPLWSGSFSISYAAETTGTSTTTDVTTSASTTTSATATTSSTIAEAETTTPEVVATDAETTTDAVTIETKSIVSAPHGVDVLASAGVPTITIVLVLLGIAVIVIVVLVIRLHKSSHGRTYYPSPVAAGNRSYNEQDARPNSPESTSSFTAVDLTCTPDPASYPSPPSSPSQHDHLMA